MCHESCDLVFFRHISLKVKRLACRTGAGSGIRTNIFCNEIGWICHGLPVSVQKQNFSDTVHGCSLFRPMEYVAASQFTRSMILSHSSSLSLSPSFFLTLSHPLLISNIFLFFLFYINMLSFYTHRDDCFTSSSLPAIIYRLIAQRRINSLEIYKTLGTNAYRLYTHIFKFYDIHACRIKRGNRLQVSNCTPPKPKCTTRSEVALDEYA